MLVSLQEILQMLLATGNAKHFRYRSWDIARGEAGNLAEAHRNQVAGGREEFGHTAERG